MRNRDAGELPPQFETVELIARIGFHHAHARAERRAEHVAASVPEARAYREIGHTEVLDSSGQRSARRAGFGALLPAAPDSFLGRKAQRIERGHDIGPVAPTVAELPVDSGAGLEPGRRHDDGIDQWALDAVVDGWLVPFVEDAHRHEQHPRADAEAPRNQKVDVGLLQLQLASFLEAFDERVFQFEFADEANARAEAVREQQHEAMEIDDAVLAVALVEVHVHVAGERAVWLRGAGVGGGVWPAANAGSRAASMKHRNVACARRRQ